MEISFGDKFSAALKIYSKLLQMPGRTAFKTWFKPAESTRYNEFAYFLKHLKSHPLKNAYILDISSPYAMAYLLTGNGNRVLKTDINSEEKLSIKESNSLSFAKEDGTALTFTDNTFDAVFSISVIEHIYEGYLDAVKEMVRVTKPGGIIYITTPVSAKITEEWINEDIYSDQHKKTDKIFFQYRFSEKDVNDIINCVPGAEVFQKHIFWERNDGDYDRFIDKLKNTGKGSIGFLKNSFLNMFVGSKILNNSPGTFEQSKSFGNISLILKKK